MRPHDLDVNASWRADAGGRSSPLVLVVEDEFLARIVAAEALEMAGFSVVSATTADEALALLAERDDIAAIFTDVEMPGALNGVALAHMVHARRPWIGIVITSGREVVARHDMPRGARFLAKPYRISDLVETLRGAGTERLPIRRQ